MSRDFLDNWYSLWWCGCWYWYDSTVVVQPYRHGGGGAIELSCCWQKESINQTNQSRKASITGTKAVFPSCK